MLEKPPFSLARNGLEIQFPFDYYCLTGPGQWKVINSVPLRRFLLTEPTEARNHLMSLRLSTGIIGELDCPAGDSDHAPKGSTEVIIGLGPDGIQALLDLGALPCVTCDSGKRLLNFNLAVTAVLEKNLDGNLENRIDKGYLTSHYDSRRLDWAKLLPLKVSPKRFYTHPNLLPDAVDAIRKMFMDAHLAVPAIGYYDGTSPDYFTAYK